MKGRRIATIIPKYASPSMTAHSNFQQYLNLNLYNNNNNNNDQTLITTIKQQQRQQQQQQKRCMVWHAGYENTKEADEIKKQITLLQKKVQEMESRLFNSKSSSSSSSSTETKEDKTETDTISLLLFNTRNNYKEQIKQLYKLYESVSGEPYYCD